MQGEQTMSEFSILITDDLSPQALELLDAADDVSYDIVKGLSPEALRDKIRGYDAVIIRSSVKITADVIENSDQLKVIGRAGAGVDNVDIDAASRKGAIVMNTPGANTIATAEQTITLMLALCRNTAQADASMRAKAWDRKKFMGVQLYGKVLGIIGLGRIGAAVAKRLQSFEMKVLAYDPYISEEVARELKITMVEMDELLAQSDFITVHAGLTVDTKNMLDAAAIGRMKSGVRIVNCARGGLIDYDALVDALNSGHVAGAALDVYPEEPLAADSPLRDMPNVVVTPHIAASTVEAQRDVGTQIVAQVLSALRGQDYRNAINMPVTDANLFRTLKPYLELTEKIGSLQMQLAGGPIKQVEIELSGDEVQDYIKPFTVALFKGLLDPITDSPVNYISAPHIATQRGIRVVEGTGLSSLNYDNLISVRVTWDGGDRIVCGSLLGHETPRVVRIDEYNIDARLEGIILVMGSVDQPGVIGAIGSLLGAHGINIAEWRYGRTAPGADSLSFINLDSEVPPDVLKQIAEMPWATSVEQIRL
jgi:D-3-phosphoglycerate dehydrogenase / 2-oxoglutarate reductase